MNKKLLNKIVQLLEDNKVSNIVTINLKDKSSIADFMIVASGTSSKHIQSVSEILLQNLKNNGYNNCKIEGSESEDWKLIDAIDVIVHLFHPEKRYIYNLEKMWEDILPKEQVRI